MPPGGKGHGIAIAICSVTIITVTYISSYRTKYSIKQYLNVKFTLKITLKLAKFT